MIEIELKEEDFLAKGGERTCFIHPLQKKQIIKVIHSKDKHNNQNELEYQYYRYLKQKNVDYSFIAQCHGWVFTNQGKGLLFDRVIDYNGNDSKHFRYYLKNKILSEKIEHQLLNELKLYLEENQILFIDVSTVNLFCQEVALGKFKLIIFDGLGARRLGVKFYLYLHCKALVKYKIKKQWHKFLENYQRDKKSHSQKCKKIVYISRSIIPSRTANSIHVMRMCNAFASLGYEVTLLAPWTKKLEEKNISNIFEYYGVEQNFELKKLFAPNIKFLKKRIYSLRCFFKVKQIKPDLVYGRDDMFAFYLIKKSGFNISFEKHEPIYSLDFNEYFFKKLIENKKQKFITNSFALKEMYIETCNVPSETILAASNGTNMIPNLKLPKHLFVDHNKIHIGYVGSLFQGRGIDIIIELAKRIPDCVFHIIGGNDRDLEFWKSQIELENLIFYGFVEPQETYKYRNMCDILLAPYQSDSEGNRSSKYMSPIKLFEYMSSKKAIVCSNFKVVYEALNDNCAILVDSSNINEWENAIKYLVQNPQKREEIAQNAYNKFLEYHTWKVRAEKILDFVLPNKR